MSRFQLLLLSLMLLIATGCDTVLQYPDGDGLDPNHPHGRVTLRVRADTELLRLGKYEYDFDNPFGLTPTGRSQQLFAASEPHQLRFTIKAYAVDDNSVSPVSQATMTFTTPLKEVIDETFDFELLPGEYRIVVWADYVDRGSESDKYYDTADFSEIILNESDGHYGSNDYRDAFYGATQIKVNYADQPGVDGLVEMERPMAKYTFVSTDLAEFLDTEMGRTGRTGRTGADSQRSAPPLSDYTVRVVYTKYMPGSFNAHNGKPVDSRTGIEYSSLISTLDGDNAQLAFDYVFTNGTDTSVAVAMEVLHSDGTVVARMPQIDVPLRRAHLTIVKGKFLTTKSGGDLGINPDFDDEFNIEIK